MAKVCQMEQPTRTKVKGQDDMLAELWSFMETGKWDIRSREMRKDSKTEFNHLIFILRV